MATFKLECAGVVTPIEETPLTDSTQSVRSVHSSIDTILASRIEKSYGSTATNIKYKSYTTTTNPVALSHSTILNGVANVGGLFIKIVSAAGSSTPEVLVIVNLATVIGLNGVGDWLFIPSFGDSQSNGDMGTNLITVSSPSSVSVAEIEIIMGVK